MQMLFGVLSVIADADSRLNRFCLKKVAKDSDILQ